jgi:hypothetical protein
MNRHFRQVGMAALAGLALLATVSCGDTATTGKSAAYLVMDRITAARGAKPGDTAEYFDVLQSDVLTETFVYEDPGLVTLHAALKNPGPDPSSPVQPTSYSLITVERYHVKYVRSDGRNVQGVDVPYEFDGGTTATVGGDSAGVGIVLVRAQSKLEAPLSALRDGLIISTIAQVTVYGRDQAGNAVSATGNITVNFANWADPDK